MGKTLKITFLAAALFLSSYLIAHSAAIYLKKFTFDEDKALDKWSTMVLNGKVDYSLLKSGDEGYVQALSEKACSALYYRIGYRLKEYPFLSWQWRVLKFPDTPDQITEIERDDYAARVYIIFPFLSFSTSKFMEYIWSENIPVGTVISHPKADNVKMIVARSGKAVEGNWKSERRNVYEDYLKAFGREPSRKAGAIAIMCDADGTNTTAESFFDDIFIEK